MRLVNLTQHAITILTATGRIVFPPSTSALRMSIEYIDKGSLDGVELQSLRFRDPQNLPQPQPGVLYIVSQICFDAMRNQRTDLAYPSKIVRDPRTREIIGCRSLIVNERLDISNPIYEAEQVPA